jgi:uncharacterized protein (TIGR00369 family)
MSMTLEQLSTFFRQAPFMQDLGVVPVAVSDGQVSTRLVLLPRHSQHTGQTHAGVLAAMADHSMGAAAQTLAPEAHWVVTAELKVSVLRPAKGQALVCEARVLKAGRMLSFTEAEVFAEAEGQRTLVLKASATMAVTAASRYTG